jgi:hypothetical protein
MACSAAFGHEKKPGMPGSFMRRSIVDVLLV